MCFERDAVHTHISTQYFMLIVKLNYNKAIHAELHTVYSRSHHDDAWHNLCSSVGTVKRGNTSAAP